MHRMLCILFGFPSSCGMFVYELVTSIETGQKNPLWDFHSLCEVDEVSCVVQVYDLCCFALG